MRSRFLLIWAVSLVTNLCLVAAMNAVVDPYDLFGWPRIAGINALKPAVRNHTALTKTYQVERARPVTVVLGTSRAYLGFDAASKAWPEQFAPVYNYRLPGTSMGRSMLRELREAWSTGRLRHVVAVLDFPAFFAPDPPARGVDDELRLKFLDDGAVNDGWRMQRLDDAFLSVFTLAALSDSVTTILSQRGGNRVLNLRADGTSTEADFAEAVRAEGMNAVFAQKDAFSLWRLGHFQHILADWHGPMPNMGLIQDVIHFCREHDMTLTLILASSHADDMEIYRRAGLWPRVEQIKVELAGLVAEANSDTVTLWDFQEYAPYTTERLPPPGDLKTRLRWFWEPVHFQRALGEIMLERVFLGEHPEFGVQLTTVNVAARNGAVREQQQPYIGWPLACEADHTCGMAGYKGTEAAR